ncbi:siderophore-interacting protein [Microbacterium betulae]|uniref:Siderophore-interacting protein n=1 Tax=Microbacterium betulae TaxID=2981139 RepID=A0AA97FMD0_9MICO|nr:siderophore-interacting protein [Microbacterium sp. AB]WOF24067.1 siderophore-interacting protein [Microbacterium sp. AB]
MDPAFARSPNVLFAAHVRGVRRISPGFVRVGLEGPDLERLVPRGLDQRMKILLPPGAMPGGLDESFLPEAEWRRRWRALPAERRPLLRSYTVGEARPEAGELDIDFFVHARPGPGSAWALRTQPGDVLMLSAPDRRREHGRHGVQWNPGRAHRVLLAGDETAYPAVRGILRSLGREVTASVVVEAGDPADASWMADELPDGQGVVCVRGERDRGGAALVEGVAGWAGHEGESAAAEGGGFYAWCATESAHVAAMRDVLVASGIAADRIHAQGYWNDRDRRPAR